MTSSLSPVNEVLSLRFALLPQFVIATGRWVSLSITNETMCLTGLSSPARSLQRAAGTGSGVLLAGGCSGTAQSPGTPLCRTWGSGPASRSSGRSPRALPALRSFWRNSCNAPAHHPTFHLQSPDLSRPPAWTEQEPLPVSACIARPEDATGATCPACPGAAGPLLPCRPQCRQPHSGHSTAGAGSQVGREGGGTAWAAQHQLPGHHPTPTSSLEHQSCSPAHVFLLHSQKPKVLHQGGAPRGCMCWERCAGGTGGTGRCPGARQGGAWDGSGWAERCPGWNRSH